MSGLHNQLAESRRTICNLDELNHFCGGKDSCYNMMQCVADGHEIVALGNLHPKCQDELDSYMYQSVGHQSISFYAEAMGLPLYRQEITGKPVLQDSWYCPTEGDEVEDLYKLLESVKKEMTIEAVSVGAIFSDYQRVRAKNVCDRLGLKMLAYLWHRNQAELLREMIDCQVKAIIIKVAALGLVPEKHLGLSIEEIYEYMIEMEKTYGLNICGEGGEYETFTLDCPLFWKKIVIDKKEIVLHSNDAFAPVAFLKFEHLHLEPKPVQVGLSQLERLDGLPIRLPV